MSFISKIENSYVAILRVVIVLFATLLLLGAAGLGFMALKEKFASPGSASGINVDTKDVIKAVVPAEEATSAQAAAASPRAHQEEYNKAFALVAPFVQKYSNGKETLDKDQFFATLDESMERFDTPELKKAYITGWISTMDASLKDKRILARAALVSAPAAAKPAAPAPVEASDGEELSEVDAAAAAAAEAHAEAEQAEQAAEAPTAEGIITEIGNAYSELFATKYMEDVMKSGGKGEAPKTASTTYLIAAGGIFFSFLCVIFLTVTIRIERNLREMAYRLPAA